MFEYREYQDKCENAIVIDLLSSPDCFPVAAVPTGAGKTKIICGVVEKILLKRPLSKILVISHTESILEQDHEALSDYFYYKDIGLYSSGLDSFSIEQITVAGIQSIYKKGRLFTEFDICIIDEAHTVIPKNKGMYFQLFDSTNMQRVGLTATHFRTGHGYIHKGKGAMFNKLSYDLCTMEEFNKLVDAGYLSKLFTKPPKLQLDVEGVRTTGGDYNLKDLSDKYNREKITKEAVKEIVAFGHNYKSWLVFAINIEHAESINSELLKLGIDTDVIHSKISKKYEREAKQKFKDGNLRCLVSVGKITTGFDAPNIDLIAILRPTKSPVLHVQMPGRGLRTFAGKDHCLILDFSGNTGRLGPINNVTVPIKGSGKKNGKPVVKSCPNCGCLHHPTVKVCEVCDHIFQFKQSIKTKSTQRDIVQTHTMPVWLEVTSIQYQAHSKKGKPDSMRVTYRCGLFKVSEYVCYDHGEYGRLFANNWLSYRFDYDYEFESVDDILEKSKYLEKPSHILVNPSEKFPEIKDLKFENKA